MRRRMDLFQQTDRDLRVDLRGGEIGVSEHLLDETDVGAAFEHQRRHRVPEQMARSGLAELRSEDVRAHRIAQVVPAERLALRREEHRAVIGFRHQLGPGFFEVLLRPRERTIADRDHAVFLSLALADEDRAALGVEIVEFQVDEFEPPHARRVERFQDGAVPQSDGIGEVRLHHHLLDFRDGQDVLGQAIAEARQFDLAGRIVQDEILPRHPFEPHAQRHQARVLAAEAQRFAVFLAVVEQVPLIAFEDEGMALRALCRAAR